MLSIQIEDALTELEPSGSFDLRLGGAVKKSNREYKASFGASPVTWVMSFRMVFPVGADTLAVCWRKRNGNPCSPGLFPTYPTGYPWFALLLLGKVNLYLKSWGTGLSVDLTGWPVGPNCLRLSPLLSVMLIWMAVWGTVPSLSRAICLSHTIP